MTPANPQLSTASRPRVGIPWRTSHEEANGITNKLQYYFAAVTAENPSAFLCNSQQVILPPKSEIWTPLSFLALPPM